MEIDNLGANEVLPVEIENYDISKDRTITLKGITDKSLKGKRVILKGLSETDILEIKQMLCDEVKRQKEGEVNENEIN